MHTMSMLHDFRIGKPLEISELWASFEALAALAGKRLPLTQAVVALVELKVQASIVVRDALNIGHIDNTEHTDHTDHTFSTYVDPVAQRESGVRV